MLAENVSEEAVEGSMKAEGGVRGDDDRNA
jgi:hypothetical protein